MDKQHDLKTGINTLGNIDDNDFFNTDQDITAILVCNFLWNLLAIFGGIDNKKEMVIYNLRKLGETNRKTAFWERGKRIEWTQQM